MSWLGPASLAASLLCLTLAWYTVPVPLVPPAWAGLALLGLAAASALAAQRRRRPKEALWGVLGAVALIAAYLLHHAVLWTYRSMAALDESPYFAADPLAWSRFVAAMMLVLAALAGAGAWRVVAARLEGAAQIIPLEQGKASSPALRFLRRLGRGAERALARPAAGGLPPVTIGVEKATGEPIEIPGVERFVHTLVVGPTGCGKTSKILAPMVFQDLEKMARGEKLGLTVVEPKGDFTDAVAAYCERLGLSYVYLNPSLPATHKFNPLEGPPHIVAESMRLVLTTMFGNQEPFFRQVQETAARQVILMLKGLKGDDLTLLDVVRALRDQDSLGSYVKEYERRGGDYDLIQYFNHELLGRLKEKYYQFASGLRQQLEDLTGNELLRRVLIGKSDVNLDRHLSDGGVLLVNTAMGPLAKLGDTFGQLFILFFQRAVFRRPEPNEWSRTPHYLYVDELPRYLNHELERLLSLGRSYRCACVLALQDPGQVEAVGHGFAKTVFTNCANKIVFGGISEASARELEREFGEEEVLARSATFDNEVLVPPVLSDGWREDIRRQPRWPYTRIMDLARDHFLCRVKKGGVYMPPVLGLADFHPAWKELTGPEAATPAAPELTPISFRPGPAEGNGSRPAAEKGPAPKPAAAAPPALPGPGPAAPPAPEPADDFWKI